MMARIAMTRRLNMRTTVYLDIDLNARLRRLIQPRGLNRFINEAMAARVEASDDRGIHGRRPPARRARG